MKILRIQRDDYPESPRCWDNLGTMICWYERLGDKHDFKDKDEFLFSLLEDVVGDTEEAEEKLAEIHQSIDTERHKSFTKAVDDEILLLLEKDYIILPIYAYEHGGITVSTHPFSCRWDSGQIGWIYCSLGKARYELIGWKTESELREKTEEVLEKEIGIYDTYLQGNTYGYTLFSLSENGITEDDTCWGFLGNNPEENGLLDYLGDNFKAALQDYGTIVGEEILVEDNGQIDVISPLELFDYAERNPLFAKFLNVYEGIKELVA